MKTIFFLMNLLLVSILNAQAIKVEVKALPDGGFQLIRNGEPYYLKGAGGSVKMEELKRYGGNSIRTWGISNETDEILEEAQRLGLTVCFGLWMGQERQGFDYSNEVAVKGQLDAFRAIIRKYKNHPAILMWGVGNEMDLDYTNFDVWKHLEEICKMVKSEDPNHPTIAVTAGLDVAEVKLINRYMPSLDILGVNTYGNISYIPSAIQSYGWKKPYMVTEWGPYGYWEVQKTSWGASIEETSTEKANTYQKSMETIASDKKNCLGSYVFLWGNKQEHTSTWFNLFLETGEETAVMDVLVRGWSGKEPANHAPSIDAFSLNNQQANQSIIFKLGDKCNAKVKSTDVDGDKLKYVWQVIPESTDKKSGGDAEIAPKPLNGIFGRQTLTQNEVAFSVPKAGQYRLFIFVYDGKNKVGTANIPFLVVD